VAAEIFQALLQQGCIEERFCDAVEMAGEVRMSYVRA
jgi:hypothetical protein